MAQKQILIVCGEASGELYAAGLSKKIIEIDPGVKISGLGGELLRKSGAEVFSAIKDISVFGFFDALKKLPQFFRLQKLILKKIQEEKPAAIVLVDFSGFNLRLAKKINKTIPVIYYVSPQVWASRAGRIKTIKKYIGKMLVLFKFEEEFYRRYDIDVDFIGHPLLDIVRPSMKKEDFCHKFALSGSKITIALLPGSRKSEIENILPIMLQAGVLIAQKIKDIQFVIAKSPQVEWKFYYRKVKGLNLELKIVEGKTYDCLNASCFCLVASGTATLETAIMQKPFVVIYKMSLLNYLLYRPQVRVPYIGMVNIVAGKKIIPEFIQFRARAKSIAEESLKILNSVSESERIKNDLAQVKSSLGQPGATLRAAKIILNLLG